MDLFTISNNLFNSIQASFNYSHWLQHQQYRNPFFQFESIHLHLPTIRIRIRTNLIWSLSLSLTTRVDALCAPMDMLKIISLSKAPLYTTDRHIHWAILGPAIFLYDLAAVVRIMIILPLYNTSSYFIWVLPIAKSKFFCLITFAQEFHFLPYLHCFIIFQVRIFKIENRLIDFYFSKFQVMVISNKHQHNFGKFHFKLRSNKNDIYCNNFEPFHLCPAVKY